MANQGPNPLIAATLGAIQDRQTAEAAKLTALVGICSRLDELTLELRKQTGLLEELVERKRKP